MLDLKVKLKMSNDLSTTELNHSFLNLDVIGQRSLVFCHCLLRVLFPLSG